MVHKQSISRLPQLCEYIARNLLFVDHVTLMGLEMIGFTRANLDALWIDPADYRDVLSEAVGILAAYRMNVSVYNHQLCLVNDDVLPYYRKSISDWKTNMFLNATVAHVNRSVEGSSLLGYAMVTAERSLDSPTQALRTPTPKQKILSYW